jgi:hypothetical protein
MIETALSTGTDISDAINDILDDLGIDTGGNGGDNGDVAEISTFAQLDAIRNNLSGSYKLTADIAIPSNWTPIGSCNANMWDNFNETAIDFTSGITPFTGSFDGNGFKITGLNINNATAICAGLFGITRNATITNVALENVNIIGGSHVGGIVGFALKSTITNSYTTGSVTSSHIAGNSSASGGITGFTIGSTIKSSYSAANITSTSNNAQDANGDGGTDASSGGIAGYAVGSTITDCYSTGNITSNAKAWAKSGGIVGSLDDSFSGNTIERCYSSGTVIANGDLTDGDAYAGGIIGEDSGNSTIRNNVAANSGISGTGDEVQRGRVMARYDDSSTISNNFALDSITSNPSYDPENEGISKSASALTTQTTYSNTTTAGGLGWNFTNVWKMTAGNYPILYWQ